MSVYHKKQSMTSYSRLTDDFVMANDGSLNNDSVWEQKVEQSFETNECK